MQIKELASITGISRNTIANYLTLPNSLPNAEAAVKIAKALNTSVEFLITGKNETTREQDALIRKIEICLEKCDNFDKETVLVLAQKMSKRKNA